MPMKMEPSEGSDLMNPFLLCQSCDTQLGRQGVGALSQSEGHTNTSTSELQATVILHSRIYI